MVFASSRLFSDPSTVVLLITAELYSIETAYLDISSEWFGILRDLWLLGAIQLQIEFFGIGNF